MKQRSTHDQEFNLADEWRDELWDLIDDAPQDIEDAYFRVITLRQQLRKLREAQENGDGILPSPTRSIASKPGDFDDTVSKLTEYAGSKLTGEAEYESAVAELTQAIRLAERASLTPWKRHGDKLRDLIQPLYEAKAAEFLDAYTQSEHATDLSDAARRGVHEAWLTADKALAEVKRIQRLYLAWVEHGIVPGSPSATGWHTGAMLFYGDPLAARKAAGARGDRIGDALRLKAGRAQLNTWSEMEQVMRPVRADYDHIDVYAISRDLGWQQRNRL